MHLCNFDLTRVLYKFAKEPSLEHEPHGTRMRWPPPPVFFMARMQHIFPLGVPEAFPPEAVLIVSFSNCPIVCDNSTLAG